MYLFCICKAYKISTEGKAKVQLQLVLHDESTATFHFINPGGQEQQLKDRDKVKELLAELLPKFKQKMSKDLEDKKRMLLENPSLYQLYSDIVVTSIVSPDDFWKYYADVIKTSLLLIVTCSF